MKLLLINVFFILIFASVAGWGQEQQPPVSELEQMTRLAASGKPKEAIENFDKIAARYEEMYQDGKTKYYCARDPVESMMYLLQAANENKGDAKVVSANWAYAYYFKAYLLVEAGRVPEAKLFLKRALALSPYNSQFHSELGSIYQREKNWPMALQTFQLAETAADFSPPNLKNSELSIAWRGIGYVFIEQNRLDEAEKMYRKCIDLNKNDSKALAELKYIQSLKAKPGAK